LYLHSLFPQISGELPNVRDALYNATRRLRDHIFLIAQNSGGTGSHRRPRDSIPLGLGGQSVVGSNHGPSIHSLSQSMDHLTLSRNSGRSASSGVWAPKVCLFLSIDWFSFANFPLLYD